MFEGNSEAADALGHYSLGVFGALSGELSYRLSGLEEKYGEEPKYTAMRVAGIAAGCAGQASQYFISGTPEIESVYQAEFFIAFHGYRPDVWNRTTSYLVLLSVVLRKY